MKQLLVVVALAFAGAAFAKGSSHPKPEEFNQPIPSASKPCWYGAGVGRWVNAWAVSAVEVGKTSVEDGKFGWKSVPAVFYHAGKATVIVLSDNPDAEVGKFLSYVEKNCK